MLENDSKMHKMGFQLISLASRSILSSNNCNVGAPCTLHTVTLPAVNEISFDSCGCCACRKHCVLHWVRLGLLNEKGISMTTTTAAATKQSNHRTYLIIKWKMLRGAWYTLLGSLFRKHRNETSTHRRLPATLCTHVLLHILGNHKFPNCAPYATRTGVQSVLSSYVRNVLTGRSMWHRKTTV